MVQFRGEDLILWTDAAGKQEFFEGDRVGTGKNSSAVIRFVNGAELALEGDTQIVISQKTDSSELGFLVSLVKGNATARGPVQFHTGQKRINLSTVNDLLGVDRPLKGKAEVYRIIRRGKTIVNVQKPKREVVEAPGIAVSAGVVSGGAVSSGSGIVEPQDGWTLWSTDSLEDRNSKVDLVFQMKIEVPKAFFGGETVPFLEFDPSDTVPGSRGLAAGKKRLLFDLSKSQGVRDVRVPWREVRQRAILKNIDGLKVYEIKVGYGLRATSNRREDAVVSQSMKVRLIGMKDVSGIPLTVALGQFDPQPGHDKWFAQSKVAGPAHPALTVNLTDAKDLWRLAPILQGAKEFSIARSRASEKRGELLISRDQRLVAVLAGSRASRMVSRAVRTLLGGDIVFEGSPRALLSMAALNERDLMTWAKAHPRISTLYFAPGPDIVAISRNFMETEAEVSRFVAQKAKAVFSEPVTVVDVK